MEFFETLETRRSIRRFTSEPVPETVVEKALRAATMAPNSSNTQTWDFYWLRSPDKKSKLVEACFSQSAARTAQELVVIVADPTLWRRSHKPLQAWVKSVNAPKQVQLYYEKLVPIMYRWGWLNSWAAVKWLSVWVSGFFRPVPRGPNTRRDMQEVAIKSAALAAENFVLALSAQGYASCMMEGFDEVRVRRLLGLRGAARVVMVVGCGREAEKGTWGPRFRLPLESVVHKI